MVRSVFAVTLVSFSLLAGCEGLTFPRGAFSARFGSTTLHVHTDTQGNTSDLNGHRFVVTRSDTVEADTILPLNGTTRVIRYEAPAYEEGAREALLIPPTSRCRVTSENPQRFVVGLIMHRVRELTFSVTC